VGASSTLLENEYCFFYNVAGLTSGYIYVTDSYRVSKTVYFEKLYAKSPDAWGRGAATRGFEYAYDNY
jgi:hypothetical protein